MPYFSEPEKKIAELATEEKRQNNFQAEFIGGLGPIKYDEAWGNSSKGYFNFFLPLSLQIWSPKNE